MTIDISRMKIRLGEKQKELQERIASLSEATPRPVDPIEASDGPQDFEEVAVDFNEIEQEQSLRVNEQALLTEVQEALKRIENGTYGKCIRCGKPIPEKRLEVIPWASRDVNCEEIIEKANLREEEMYNEETN